MKKIFFAFVSLSLLFIMISCDKELPYPINEVKKGVVIDVSRVPGTDGVLSDGITSGNYKITLIIPENQGDYSIMKNAQLIAVLQDVNGKMSSKVVKDNITQFPQEIDLSMTDVYSKFGQKAPALGQILYFTVDVVMNDGSIIPGWTEYAGFNNVSFGGWMINGRPYSSNVRYSVACPWSKDPVSGTFIGTFTCDESSSYGTDSYTVTLSHNPNLPADKDIPIGVTAANLYGIDITPVSPNIWGPTNEVITVWINSENLTLVIPNQDTGDKYSTGAAILWYNAKDMSVSTCSNTIKFTVQPYIPGVGGWNPFTFTIHP